MTITRTKQRPTKQFVSQLSSISESDHWKMTLICLQGKFISLGMAPFVDSDIVLLHCRAVYT